MSKKYLGVLIYMQRPQSYVNRPMAMTSLSVMKTNSMQMTDTKEVLSKALLNLAIGTVGSYYLLGEESSVNLFNFNIPSSLIVGASTATGSLLTDFSHDWILNKLPQSEQYRRIESVGVGLGLAAGGTVGALSVLGGLPGDDMLRAGLVGVGTKVVSDYTYQNIINKSSHGFIL